MANRMNFRSTDNGNIFAEYKDDNQLMGVWSHNRQEGTIRITDPDRMDVTFERRGVSGAYVATSLTEWLEFLMKLGEEPTE